MILAILMVCARGVWEMLNYSYPQILLHMCKKSIPQNTKLSFHTWGRVKLSSPAYKNCSSPSICREGFFPKIQISRILFIFIFFLHSLYNLIYIFLHLFVIYFYFLKNFFWFFFFQTWNSSAKWKYYPTAFEVNINRRMDTPNY